jgi:hypothetical protein
MQEIRPLSAVIGCDLTVVAPALPSDGYSILQGSEVLARARSQGRNETFVEANQHSWKLTPSRWRARLLIRQLASPTRRGTLDFDCPAWPTHATARFDDDALFKWHPTELPGPEYGFSTESGSLVATFDFNNSHAGMVRLVAETISEQHSYMLLFLGIHLAMRI